MPQDLPYAEANTPLHSAHTIAQPGPQNDSGRRQHDEETGFLTGAAGRLGPNLREPLSQDVPRTGDTDIVDDIGTLYEARAYAKADVAVYGPKIAALLEALIMGCPLWRNR